MVGSARGSTRGWDRGACEVQVSIQKNGICSLHAEARPDSAKGRGRTGGDRRGCGMAVVGSRRFASPGPCLVGRRRRSRPPTRDATGLHPRHPRADGRAVLHALDAASRQPARSGFAGRAAGSARPRAHARLPALVRRRDRSLALRRTRPVRQRGLSLSRPPVRRRGRSIPVRDDPAGPLPRTNAALSCEGAGRDDGPPETPSTATSCCFASAATAIRGGHGSISCSRRPENPAPRDRGAPSPRRQGRSRRFPVPSSRVRFRACANRTCTRR